MLNNNYYRVSPILGACPARKPLGLLGIPKMRAGRPRSRTAAFVTCVRFLSQYFAILNRSVEIFEISESV